jgi:4-hydroxybenzoate polyprenyltransferase
MKTSRVFLSATDAPSPASTNPIARELGLLWAFISGDLSTAVFPALLFTLAAWKVEGADPARLPVVLGRSSLYFILYIYAFCLANQATGIEEDRRNKPHRPLVTGAVSIRGAWTRWAVVMALFALVGAWFGVLEYAIGWQVIIVAHNVVRGARSWVVKNLSNSLGLVVQLAAAWQMVAPVPASAWRWIWVMAIIVFPLIPVQDLRDMDGDREAGRRTLPLILGERATRIFLTVGFALAPLVIHFALMRPAGDRPSVWITDAVLAIVSLVVGVRVLLLRTPRKDHQTYMLFTYWYCLLLIATIIVL